MEKVQINNISDEPQLQTKIGIEARGFSSRGFVRNNMLNYKRQNHSHNVMMNQLILIYFVMVLSLKRMLIMVKNVYSI